MDAALGASFGGNYDDGFGGLGDEFAVNVAAQAEVVEVAAGQGNAAGARLQWTNVMSGFVLRRFTELVAQGVKTDKGFKDVHLNAVARDLSEFINQEISGTQVYNHLRKWRTRWVKICRLKELSGAGWDEDNFVITLDPKHYNGHVKDHPKDAEFLNTHLVNYREMQAIFASGVATGRFAMGSNEALGQPAAQETIDLDADAPPVVPVGKEDSPDVDKSRKRKRGISDEDRDFMTGMTDAIYSFASAVTEGNHSEAAPGIYEAVMGVPDFTRSELMHCLNHMMLNKATALVFVGMKPEDKQLWCSTYLNDKFNK